MASSMTMPTARVSASSVMLFSEKSMPRMSVNVAMMDGGDGDGGDRDGAPVAHEKQNDGAGENTAEDQMFEKRVDGSLDEIGDVVNDQKLNAGRQLRAQFIELGFHVVSDVDGVGAGLAQNLNADDVLTGHALAKESRPGAQLLRAVLDLRHIAHANLGCRRACL